LSEGIERQRCERKIGVKLTKRSEMQSTYIGVPAEVPFNADHSRY
jgi:hypothetical protein